MVLHLKTRFFRNDTPSDVPCREENFTYQEVELLLPVQQTALILIDLWNVHHIESFVEREEAVLRQVIVPLIDRPRQTGITVVHAPSPRVTPRYAVYQGKSPQAAAGDEPSWPPAAFRNREGEYRQYAGMWPGLWKYWDGALQEQIDITPHVQVREGDFVIETGQQLHDLCEEKQILHLLMAGFATTHCILNRDYGIRPMRLRGYNTILLREATTGIEYPDTVQAGLATELAIREAETQHGFSASVDDFHAACSAFRRPV